MTPKTFGNALPEFFGALPGYVPVGTAPLSTFLVARIEEAAERADDAQADAHRAAKELMERAQVVVEHFDAVSMYGSDQAAYLVERASRVALAEAKLSARRETFFEVLFAATGAEGVKLMRRTIRERAEATS